MVFFLVFVEWGAAETDPDPSRHVAAVVVALAELGVVVNFNLPVLLVFVPRQFDDFKPAILSCDVAVFTKFAGGQGIRGAIAFAAVR